MPELKTEEEIRSGAKKVMKLAKTLSDPYIYQIYITRTNHITGTVTIWRHNKRYTSEFGAKVAAGKLNKKLYSPSGVLLEDVSTKII